MKSNSSTSRRVPVVVLVAFCLVVLLVAIFWPTLMSLVSGALLLCVTAIYAFLTYEIVRVTRESRTRPYVGLTLIAIRKPDAPFIEKFAKSVKDSVEWSQLLEDYRSGTARTRDIVLVRCDNLGDTDGIETAVHFRYNKRDLGEEKEISKAIQFGVVSKGEPQFAVVETFTSPTQGDFFDIRELRVTYNDVFGMQAGNASFSNDMSHSVRVIRVDDEAVIAIRPAA